MYSQFGDYDGLGKFKFKKVLKKVGKVARIAAVAPFAVPGMIFAPGLARKAMGIKAGTKAERIFKKVRKGIIAATAVTGAVVFGPAVLSALGTAASSAGSMTIGGLKFLSGKLTSLPSGLMNIFKSRGVDPFTLPPDQVIQEAVNQGYLSQDQAIRAYQEAAKAGYAPSLEQAGAGAGMPPMYGPETPEGGQPVAEAGMFGGGMTGPLVIGAGILAVILFSGQQRRR